MKKLIIIMTLIALLTGCTASSPSKPTDSTTAPVITEACDTTPSTEAATLPTTVPTVETTIYVDENIEIFTKLLTAHFDSEAPFRENYYNTAMCCEFSCPEELPLATFFQNGLANSDVTDEEHFYPSGQFIITLQSRESEGGDGFRILSNLPA